jgi:hypothetical protein
MAGFSVLSSILYATRKANCLIFSLTKANVDDRNPKRRIEKYLPDRTFRTSFHSQFYYEHHSSSDRLLFFPEKTINPI